MPCTLKHFLGYSRCQICYMLHWLNEGESIKRQKGLSQLQKLTKMQEIKKKIKMDPRPSQLPQLYHIFRCDHASLLEVVSVCPSSVRPSTGWMVPCYF